MFLLGFLARINDIGLVLKTPLWKNLSKKTKVFVHGELLS